MIIKSELVKILLLKLSVSSFLNELKWSIIDVCLGFHSFLHSLQSRLAVSNAGQAPVLVVVFFINYTRLLISSSFLLLTFTSCSASFNFVCLVVPEHWTMARIKHSRLLRRAWTKTTSVPLEICVDERSEFGEAWNSNLERHKSTSSTWAVKAGSFNKNVTIIAVN